MEWSWRVFSDHIAALGLEFMESLDDSSIDIVIPTTREREFKCPF
jgi:hypothetical protein